MTNYVTYKFAEDLINYNLNNHKLRGMNNYEFLNQFYYQHKTNIFNMDKTPESIVEHMRTLNKIEEILKVKTQIMVIPPPTNKKRPHNNNNNNNNRKKIKVNKELPNKRKFFNQLINYSINPELEQFANKLVNTINNQNEIFFPTQLKKFFRCVEDTYHIKLDHLKFTQMERPNYFKAGSIRNEKICVTTLSMGKESLWNLLSLHRKMHYNKIIAVYIDKFNYSSSYREKEKLNQFFEHIRNKFEFSNIKIIIIKYSEELISHDNMSSSLKINDQPLKEHLLCMQWIQLVLSEIIINEGAGEVVFPMDFEEQVYNKNSYFGDQHLGLLLFNEYLNSMIGETKIRLFGLKTSREDKVKFLLEHDMLRFNSSCYMNWNYFSMRKRQNLIPQHLSMCGSCFKCIEDIQIYQKLGLL